MMKQVGVAMLLLMAVTGISGEVISVDIDTTVDSNGTITPDFTKANSSDTFKFTFTLAPNANLYFTLGAFVPPEGASLVFSQPLDKDQVVILNQTTTVSDVQVIYTNTDKCTVELNVGANFNKTIGIPIALNYTVQACEVNVNAATSQIRSPVYIAEAGGNVSCTYNLASATPGGAVGLTFGEMNFNGTLKVTDVDGTTSVTYTNPRHSGAFMGGAVRVELLDMDMSEAGAGFSASFITINPDCSTVMKLNAGGNKTVSSPGYPSNYPSGETCWTVVTGPEEGVLEISLDGQAEFANMYDYAAVHDGDDMTAHPLMLLDYGNSRDTDAVVLSSGQTLFIMFVSDYVGTAMGFSLNIKHVVFGGRYYGTNILALNDTLSDPAATNITYQLVSNMPEPGMAREQMTLSTLNATFPNGSMISVYDGDKPTSALIATYMSNADFYPVFSSGREMTLVLTGFLDTKGKLSNDSSFSASVLSAPVHPQNRISAEGEGTYKLEGGDGLQDAQWMIINPDKERQVVELSVSMLQLVSEGNVSSSVTVQQGLQDSAPVLATFTSATPNTNVPKIYVRDGARIVYKMEGGAPKVSGTVLQAAYRIVPDCHGPPTPDASSFSVSTPGFPDRYPYNSGCEWTTPISAPQPLHVSFATFDLAQNHFLALSAKVEAPENNGTTNETVVSYGQYSGQSLPNDLIISGDELNVKFSAAATTGNGSSWLVGQGVMANVRLLDCGGNETTGSGDFSSPQASENSTLCVWIITVPAEGKENGSVNIINFDLEISRPMEDSFELVVRDGGNEKSEVLPVDLSKKKQEKLESRYNQLYVEYRKPAGEVPAEGLSFSIKYTTYECPVSHQCGNGVCMHDSWKCDGHDDCGDFSDETGCTVSTGKQYGPIALFIMFIVSTLFGIFLALLIPPCIRKIRSRVSGSGTGYGNLEEPVV